MGKKGTEIDNRLAELAKRGKEILKGIPDKEEIPKVPSLCSESSISYGGIPKPFSSEVDHPKHYNLYSVEVIDMMISIWGVPKVIDFCIINAFKYRMRIGLKASTDADLAKEKWYLDKAKELNKVLD